MPGSSESSHYAEAGVERLVYLNCCFGHHRWARQWDRAAYRPKTPVIGRGLRSCGRIAARDGAERDAPGQQGKRSTTIRSSPRRRPLQIRSHAP